MSSSSAAPRAGSTTLRILAPALALAVLFAAWQASTVLFEIPASVLPSPSRVLEAGWGARESIAEAAGATLTITLAGLLTAMIAAVVLAAVLSFSPPLRVTFLPLLIAAQSVPIIVLAPLFVIWFGFDEAPKIALVAIVSMLPLTISTLQGFLAADPDAVTLLRSMGASRWSVFLRLRVPVAVPHFITGLRIMTSFIVVAAIFSEYVGARVGLGIYMQAQKNLFRTDLVFAAVFVSIAIGLALFALTYLIEAIAMPWERRRKAHQR
jgi:ABC-type nitrate/sulfonate/bicarbonate transport system permease component